MCSLHLIFVTMVTAVLGCSPPEGGYVPPTPAQKVFYSEYVVIGEVRSTSPDDPLYGNMGTDSTYSARVYVQCSYKGKPLPGMITVGGAGYIPGLCTAKNVEVNKKYVLFLSAAKTKGNETIYEQREVAEPYYHIRDYLDVCGLQMVYPEVNGMILKRQVCAYEKEGPCKYYDRNTGRTEIRTVETSSPASTVRKATESKEVVSVNVGQLNVQSTTEKDGNGSSGINPSVGLLLLSFLSILY